jgi:hypothetical protein
MILRASDSAAHLLFLRSLTAAWQAWPGAVARTVLPEAVAVTRCSQRVRVLPRATDVRPYVRNASSPGIATTCHFAVCSGPPGADGVIVALVLDRGDGWHQ